MSFVRSVVVVVLATVVASGCATGVGVQQNEMGGCLTAAGAVGGLAAAAGGVAGVASSGRIDSAIPAAVGVGVAGLVVGAGIGVMALATDAVVADAIAAGADVAELDRIVVDTRLHGLGVGFMVTGIGVGFMGAGATALLMGQHSADGPFYDPGLPIAVGLGTAALVGASVGTGSVLLLVAGDVDH